MNEIVKHQPSGIERFGDKQTMDVLMQRGAAIFQVSQEDLKLPENQGALMKAMQWTLTYGAMPGRHIHLIPANKNKKVGTEWVTEKIYSVADSYEWRKASADQKAQQMRWQPMTQTIALSPEEIKAQSGEYTPGDKGYKSRVLFKHEIEMCQMMGIVYDPPWHYGFWKVKSYYDKKNNEWKPDNIPTGRTADWQAMKRAEKSALAQHFELQPLANWEQMSERQRVAKIEDEITAIEPLPERVHSDVLTYQPTTTDEEGVFIVVPEPPKATRRQAPPATPGANVLNALTVETNPPAAETKMEKQSTPHSRLFGKGFGTFGPKWDEVRPVIVGIITNGEFSSESDLTDEEREALTDSFSKYSRYWQTWMKTKGAMHLPNSCPRRKVEETAEDLFGNQ